MGRIIGVTIWAIGAAAMIGSVRQGWIVGLFLGLLVLATGYVLFDIDLEREDIWTCDHCGETITSTQRNVREHIETEHPDSDSHYLRDIDYQNDSLTEIGRAIIASESDTPHSNEDRNP